MKNPSPRILLVAYALLVAAWALTPSGCSNKHVADIHIPDPAATLAGVHFTEATVMGEIADVRLALAAAVKASEGLSSEPAVRSAAAGVETSIAEIEATLKAHPAADVEKLIADFMKAIGQLKEVIKTRDAEILRLKDANAVFWNRILVGLGITLSLAAGTAAAVGFYAVTIPIIGPALGRHLAGLLGIAAGTCFLLAYLAAWTRAHPVWTAGIVVGVIGAGIGMAYVNIINHRRDLAA